MTHTRTIGEALAGLPTLSTGQAFSLKLETDALRVWLARVGPDDGLDPADAVAIECRDSRGRWLDLAAIHPDTPLAFTRSALVAGSGLPANLAGDVAAVISYELKQRDPMRP